MECKPTLVRMSVSISTYKVTRAHLHKNLSYGEECACDPEQRGRQALVLNPLRQHGPIRQDSPHVELGQLGEPAARCFDRFRRLASDLGKARGHVALAAGSARVAHDVRP